MFLLSILLLHEERSVIRSRNKALSGVSSRCGQTPENTSTIQYRYRVCMVIWKIDIFSASTESSLYTWKENNTSYLFLCHPYQNCFRHHCGWVHIVQQQTPVTFSCPSLHLCYQGYIWTLSEINFFFHRSRKKGAFLLRKGLDKALLPFFVTCQYVFATLLTAWQDKCPSSTRGTGWPVTHSL